MPTLEIEIPKQTLDHLDMQPGEFAVTMKAMTALKLYELGQLSSHEAAALANLSRVEFLQLLRTYQVPPFEQLDETGAPLRPINELSDALGVRRRPVCRPSDDNVCKTNCIGIRRAARPCTLPITDRASHLCVSAPDEPAPSRAGAGPREASAPFGQTTVTLARCHPARRLAPSSIRLPWPAGHSP